MKDIAIIGSGLASISAAKVLISRGIKPTILDVGDILDEKTKGVIDRMSGLSPREWTQLDIDFVTKNSTIHNKDKIPQKLAFGSDYFYGKNTEYMPINTEGAAPPASYAKGGFTVGWGAAVLPPDDCDIDSWPIGNEELTSYYKLVLNDVPYSATNDDLSIRFPVFSDSVDPLDITTGNRDILNDLKSKDIVERYGDVLFGQSRLLVKSSECKYCGYCMSGCVYNCIYKANNDFNRLIDSKLVNYVSNVLVKTVLEKNGKVEVSVYERKNNKFSCLSFDKVLIAAGAVNSTRIVLNSKEIFDKTIKLLSTVTFIAPAFRFKKSKIGWPNANTQPGIFFEYKEKEVSSHWVHTQLSTPNEMVLEKLGIDFNKRNLFQWIKKKIAEHLVVIHGNVHSDHANGYFLSLKKGGVGESNVLYSKREKNKHTYNVIKKVVWKIFYMLRKVNCYVMIPFLQNSTQSGGFHVGGTMPMTVTPIKETDTNLLGSPKGWSNIHVIDSSIFPSIPATTVGLLIMANAARIATEIDVE